MSQPNANQVIRVRPRRQAGFTMVELLLTLVVTVFGLLGILGLHSSLSQGSTYQGRTQEAVTAGTQVMESLRAMRPSAVATAVTGTSGSPPFSNTNYTTVLGRNGMSYTIAVYVTAVSSTLWKLRVVASWADDTTGETRSMPIELLRTSQEAL